MWHSGNWGNEFCNGVSIFGAGHGFFGWIFPVLFLGLILFSTVWALKQIFFKEQHITKQ